MRGAGCCLLVIGVLLTMGDRAHAQWGPQPQPGPPPPHDEWFGADKALHFGASAGLAVGGYAASALVFEDRSARLAVGASLALTLGVAKELNDLAGHGNPSWKDLAWDVVGTVTGLAVAYVVDRFLLGPLLPASGTARRPLRQGPRPTAAGLVFVF